MSQHTSYAIELHHLGYTYPGAAERALGDVTLICEQGSFTALVGPSGCGKSTLLRIVAGVVAQTEGACDVLSMPTMVFQSGVLLPWLTASENVALAYRGAAGQAHTPGEKKERIAAMLSHVGMLELGDRYPHELSGGQQQRVGFARALVVEPQILLLDEPFSALDVATTDSLHELLGTLWRERHMTVLMVSHSPHEAVHLAERVVVMHGGHITAEHTTTGKSPEELDALVKKLEEEIEST